TATNRARGRGRESCGPSGGRSPPALPAGRIGRSRTRRRTTVHGWSGFRSFRGAYHLCQDTDMQMQRQLVPGGAGIVLMTTVLLIACGGAGAAPPAQDEHGQTESGAPREQTGVVPGLEVLLRDSAHLVRGKRVGFITNQ